MISLAYAVAILVLVAAVIAILSVFLDTKPRKQEDDTP